MRKKVPNGLSSNPRYFAFLTNQNLLFWTYKFYKTFDQNGQLIRDLELNKLADEYLEGTEYYPMRLFEDVNTPERILALVMHSKSGTNFILDFDLISQTFKKINLPELEKNSDYKVELLSDGRPTGGYGGAVSSYQFNGKIIYNTKAFNEVLVFDLKTDSLYVKKWDTPLLGYRRTYLPPKTVEFSSQEFKDMVRKSDEDISFGSLVWDDKNERYFRFSEKKHFSEELTDFGSYVSTGADVFLSVFDKDFNLISEYQIPELTHSIGVHFVKDGKIWMYENINDELAFVIMDVEIL
ncbi:DUF4221 family protein [Algoriphagus antarcticus]|uniref:Uncharacterized protein DUF4221 n=1 Tax=Algoriphagus antarcticus TaxID=238540 RepID=A0A3E0EAD4_9BACT|nr:DUF4221 family protein [Algoriphagus antarcticus]REG94693.1 uncharacterized protein DUF4221 [Algoriphagus antarcticus]